MLSRTASVFNHRILLKTYGISQNIISQSMHINHIIGNTSISANSTQRISRYSLILSSPFIRSISNDGSAFAVNITDTNKTTSITETDGIIENIPLDQVSTNLINNIPDAPLPPAPEILDLVAPLAEPTLKSLGLAGWSPIGITQQLLELVHVSGGMPWWATITIGTIVVRTMLFPLVIIQQKNAARFSNAMPGMSKIQAKITEARTSGDQFEVTKSTQELLEYMRKHNCSPLKSMIVPLVQAPIFISFFFALKRMAALPVQSMTTGGALWFTDLTIADPYYLLPIITSCTLAITIRFGVDTPQMQSSGMFKYVLQAFPFIILPFTATFYSAITWYWVSTNIISLIQVMFLKTPIMREICGIPKMIDHPKSNEPKKNFVEGFKESWKNMSLAREMVDRQQLDNVQFNKAGRGPIPKTYVYNPARTNLVKSKMSGKS